MAKFCIGDRVRISKSSELYSAGNTGSNPANIGGKILSNTCDGNYIYNKTMNNEDEIS